MSDNKVLGRLTRPIKPLEALLVWAIGMPTSWRSWARGPGAT
jgi:hypothetical protein